MTPSHPAGPLRARADAGLRSITVGIAALEVSKDPGTLLVTYALGSCIGLILHDPVQRAAGLLHFMLPLSRTAPEQAKLRPEMFADTGVPLLFERMARLGCKMSDLVIRAAGGGSFLDGEGVLDIGNRNYTILRKMLWKSGLMITAEDVGGTRSRTVRVYPATGEVFVRSGSEEAPL